MSGLYLHIPFCRQACHYCNFHFSTSLRHKETMVDALLRELAWRRDYLPGGALNSVYFGGGTPSLLSAGELSRLFAGIEQTFTIQTGAEITLEANPDDLTEERIRQLRDSPVNRLSIGVQSFFGEDLAFMNRAHDATEARQSIERALAAGFDDLTIDLIYGGPTTPDEHWAENLRIAIGYGIPHLSAYCLTVEERTALHHFVKTGRVPPVEEERAARQFGMLLSAMQEAGYEHYEISNFARPGRYARHNSSYWRGEPYLGVGPSAHSFDGASRQWNVANNARYIRILQAASRPEDLEPAGLFEWEVLTHDQRYNEYVMTGLRTIWGVERRRLAGLGPSYLAHFLHAVQPFLDSGEVIRQGDAFRLSDAGKLLADGIAAAVFI